MSHDLSPLGFRKTPFTRELTVRERFPLDPQAQVAAALTEAVQERMSAALIAPAGTGKTVALRMLVAALPETRFQVHYVKVTGLSKRDLCKEIAVACGLSPTGIYPALVRKLLCPASATVSPTCTATAASIWHASICRSSLPTGYASIPNATNSLSTRPCNGSARHCCCWTPWSDFILSTKTALQTSLLCSPFCAPSTAAINSLWFSSTTWPSAPGAISASPCAAPPICMPGPTPPAISCGAPTTVCNSPSSTAPLPLPTRFCCASQAAATSLSRCSSTALPPRRPRSPRRSAPLSAAPASRSPGPSCANACASTTLVSVSPSKLSNNAASPSAAPTAGTCRHDPHPRLPTRSHPAAVPLFHRSAPGTHSERIRLIGLIDGTLIE